ncbi:MAG: MarR family transcriptional regulator [Firmicutes bacterium]|nr:MarR family transcriptional regulator [Bacillota bacterium]
MHEKYILYFLSRTKKKMVNYIENQLEENGLNDLIPSHGNILTVLYNNGKLTMKEIANLIGRDKSTVTPLVNKLVKLGYIKKEKCQKDRRLTYITLSNKGIEIEAKYNKISKNLLDTAYENFSEEEQNDLLRLLKKLNNNFS